MSKRWYQENKRDPWRRDARSKGYRARSAYKLKQIQDRFGLIRNGDAILDIGCHPGGWTQVAVEEAGLGGLVVGVDILTTSAIDGAEVIVGDITQPETIDRIREILGDRVLNCVISDISPRLTGRYDTDQAISLELSTMALDVASALLAPGGCFVTKVFQGAGIEGLVDAAKQRFSSVGRFSPTASRSASSETYLVCQNKLPKPRGVEEGVTAMDQLKEHLASIGIVVEHEEPEGDTRVGFRKLERRE
jgi:23S rRNA (uridine2552-2'-O)-methyltransferase